MSVEQKDKFLVQFKVGDEDVKLSPSIVRDYLTNGVEVSLPEFKMFAELCKARKLNPFLKEAYIIKFGNQPATIVVGKDAILKRAINNKNFNGREQGIIVLDKNEEVQYRKGTFKLNDDVLVGGWAKVYRKDWEHPTEITVSFDEVAQTKKDGTMNSNWATKGATMVEKVALVRALRETFAEELGGMIDESESWSNETLERQSSQNIKAQKDTFENEAVDAEVVETEIDFDAV
ncbi:MAG: phage recombination protein Bet [Gammaproteobacteria bacterium]|nr:phage recombination protein Bet [Gammaproteobacteria bacterium]